MIDKLNALEQRFEELSAIMSEPSVIANPSVYQKHAKSYRKLRGIVENFREYKDILRGIKETKALLNSEEDPEMRKLAQEELNSLEQRAQACQKQLQLLLTPKDPNDEKNVLLEIRAGTGGSEATLFAAELFRMYSRHAERCGWRVEIMEEHASEVGGYKEIIAMIEGDRVYSKLKYESGVHRVQRVPVTEASGRIHTSTATVSVLPEADEIELEIPEKDLRIDVYRSSGPGGQSVNTTDSAVRVTHLPTGMMVAIQDEKSQHKNKAKALAILRARLKEQEEARQAEERGDQRRSQVGTGERAEKIRTCNFPDDRVTDHRIGLTVHNLPGLLEGDLDRVIEPLAQADQAARLARLGGDDGS